MNSFMNSFMNSLDWLCTNPSHLLLVLAQKTQFQHGFPNQPIIPLGERHRLVLEEGEAFAPVPARSIRAGHRLAAPWVTWNRVGCRGMMNLE